MFYLYNLEILKKKKKTKEQKNILKKEQKKALKKVINSENLNQKIKIKAYTQCRMRLVFNLLNSIIMKHKRKKRSHG